MAKAKGTASKKNTKKTKPDEETVRKMIEEKAYELYEKRGGEHGNDFEDWFEAEKIVMEKIQKKSK
jgi:hypothetical protein